MYFVTCLGILTLPVGLSGFGSKFSLSEVLSESELKLELELLLLELSDSESSLTYLDLNFLFEPDFPELDTRFRFWVFFSPERP
jgi:hypothetical protein